MSEIRETALLDIKAAVDRLAESDEMLSNRLAEAIERACATASATWPQPAEAHQSPDPDALARLSGSLACFARCLPLSIEGGILVVLAAEPIDMHALRLVEAQVGQVRVVTAPAEVVWRGLETAYGQPVKKGRKKAVASAPPVEVPTEEQVLVPEVALITEDLQSAEMAPLEEVETESVEVPVAPMTIPPDADLLAAFEGDVEIPTVAPAPESSATLGADDIAALFSAAEASAEPVESEPEPAETPSLDAQFDELMAEVGTKAAEPTDIHEPRTQNLDLLSAFEGLSEPVALTEAPTMRDVDVHAINPDALPDDLELPTDPDDPEKISAQVQRIALLLHEEDSGPGSGLSPDLVPLDFALAAKCAPVAVDGEDLICLIEEPPNLKAAEAVAEAAGMSLRLQLASRDKVLARLHEVYGEFDEAALAAPNNAKEPKEGLLAKIKGKFKKAA
ncbi:MAG: hypothetical protein K1X67_10005 [Fimbriimonadaceae bacterium]|nr:hypothetical protein [Fimbriimonadaceae bacterium]